MATKHPRINVVAEPEMYYAIKRIAKKEGISMSLAARDLIKEALVIYEDIYWAIEAEKRAKNFDPKTAISHEDAWK